MRVLIVGYGSIGSRHANVLDVLGCDITVVSRRSIPEFDCFQSIDSALNAASYDYAVIASETAQHFNNLLEIAKCGFTGTVLVEKPLFHKQFIVPENSFSKLLVAYNLRFHPLLQKLKYMLQDEIVLSANVYVGQYLPGWRPGRDYRETSSSMRFGGGVLRDLSHELDYLLWLFGRWQRVAAIGGHYSHLELECDDIFTIVMATEKCPAVSVQMNYLDRVGRRIIVINTDTKTIKLDIVNCMLDVNGARETCRVERNETYTSMHRAILGGSYEHLCMADQGNEVMSLIDAAEQAADKGEWIKR